MSESEGEGASATRKAIERTYRERGRGFLTWARRHVRDAATAEDILQDAFIRALANVDALSPVEDVAAWVFSAMRNRLVDLWRGQGSRRRAGAIELPAEVLEEVAVEARLDPQDQFLRNEMLAALEVAIDALPAPQREVIRAQALGGVAFRDLAKATGVSIDTLMARKRYAIRKLAVALEYWMDE
ncbi:MAG TPA: RNA polymerase sigma factor [Candidatus Acidoferrum sp.]|jgi:RNA polymerase sigma factor (sigma-70 family)|nr:RNA polymerase sigma factor [Candidatus Acidoferrum sp.]